ncbi:MAG: hypothetical protein M3N29_04315 [Chloroflexota bacterium]|nr:hypothetical protein [Chloroflexota bacterium]
MNCPECAREIPPASRFCAFCGAAVRRSARRDEERPYRVQPGEQVSQLALISTIMPHTDRGWADHYRWALAAGVLTVIVLAMTGFIAVAVAAGAVLLPAVYFLYFVESRVSQGAAPSVVLNAMVVPALIAVAATLLVLESPWARELRGSLIAAQSEPLLGGAPLVDLVAVSIVVGLLVAVGTNLGPVLLARRPAFDDLLDGFTFGIAAGLVYAGVETIVVFRDVFLSPQLQTGDPVAWAPILAQVLLIKPVVYALVAGMMVSVFSGKGEGYDGLTPAYGAAFVLGVITLSAYWIGVRVLALWPSGPVLGLAWGLVLAAVLVLRARRTLQDGLMEKAIDEVRELWRSKAGTTVARDCPECEMPMLPGSAFCSSCGVTLRATRAGLEAREALAVTRDPTVEPAADERPRLTRTVTVAVIVAATLVGGALGLVAAAAAGRPAAAPGDALGEAVSLPVVGRQVPAAERDEELPRPSTPDISRGPVAAPDGPHVMLGEAAVALPVPTGWRVASGDGRSWALLTGDGSGWVLAWLEPALPGAPRVNSADVLRTFFEHAFAADPRLVDVAASHVRALPAFGRLVDRAMLSYRATYADAMFTSRFRANLYGGVRNDGSILIIEVRRYPGGDWDSAVDDWYGSLYQPTWESYGQSPLPPGYSSRDVSEED